MISRQIVGAILMLLAILPAGHAATRVAVVTSRSGAEGRDVLALVEVALSREPELELLDRTQVERVLEEQKLWTTGLTNVRQALAAGKLLDVEVFAALETMRNNSQALAVVCFDARTGERLNDTTLPPGEATEQALAITKAINAACRKRSATAAERRPVCLLMVRNADLPRELDSLCETVGQLLERRLLESAHLTVLERDRLAEVNKERALPTNAKAAELLASLTVLELVVGRNEAGLLATVALTDSTGAKWGERAARVEQRDPPALAEALAGEIARVLKAAPPAHENRALESGRFAREAKFLAQDRNLPAALRAAEAAVALTSTNVAYQARLANLLAWNLMRQPGTSPGAGPPAVESLPVARRALELCRVVRQAQLKEDWESEDLCDGAEEMLARQWWEEVRAQFEKLDSATQTQALEFQERLREHMVGLRLQAAHARYAGRSSSSKYDTFMTHELRNLGGYVPSASVWTEVSMRMVNEWLQGFEDAPMAWGGWYLSPERTLARLCCQAAGIAELVPTFLGRRHPVPPSAVWELSASDLDQFRKLFEKMLGHRDPAVRCYGSVGLVALELRKQSAMTEHAEQRYRQAMQLIRDQIATPSREPSNIYRAHFYTAARDLIDLLPDRARRRREHVELFEYMLTRNELVHWTVMAVTDHHARRFMQYNKYQEAFPLDSAGYTPADYPWLLRNIEIATTRFTEGTAQDVDAAKLSFRNGTFDRELEVLRRDIYDAKPELAPPAAAPWTEARELFAVTGKEAGAINRLTSDTDALYAALTGKTGIQVWRILLNGGAPQLLREIGSTNFSPNVITGLVADDGNVYLGIKDVGIYSLPTGALINVEAGLPSNHVGPFAVADGKLYVALDEGHLVAYHLQTRQVEMLVSRRRTEPRCPLDNLTQSLQVHAILADPARKRVLFSVGFGYGVTCDPLIGLWQINLRDGAVTQLLALHVPATWVAFNTADELLAHCPRNTGKTDCPASWSSLVAVDLRTDTGRMLASFQKLPAGPTVPHRPGVSQLTMWARPPFVRLADWVWYRDGNSVRRSLTTGQVEDLRSIVPVNKKRCAEWYELFRVDNGMIVSDRQHIWLLTLPEPAKESR